MANQTAETLSTMSLKGMLDYYNKMNPSGVVRRAAFKNKQDGLARIQNLIEANAKAAPKAAEKAAAPKAAEKADGKAAPKAAPKADGKAAPKAARTKMEKANGVSRIAIIPNSGKTRRPGTDALAHFEKMKGKPTIQEYLANFEEGKPRRTARQWLWNTIRDGMVEIV